MPILAEVADKEPTITEIWCLAAVCCLVSVVMCRWRRAASLVALSVATLWAWIMISELRDPFVGPAILRELGRGYISQAYFVAILPFVAIGIGLLRKGTAKPGGRGGDSRRE
jgi:hypothetical protein